MLGGVGFLPPLTLRWEARRSGFGRVAQPGTRRGWGAERLFPAPCPRHQAALPFRHLCPDGPGKLVTSGQGPPGKPSPVLFSPVPPRSSPRPASIRPRLSQAGSHLPRINTGEVGGVWGELVDPANQLVSLLPALMVFPLEALWPPRPQALLV